MLHEQEAVLRRPASVGVDAVFGTVWDALSSDGRMASVGTAAHAADAVADEVENPLAFY
jgi:hypothetical protein